MNHQEPQHCLKDRHNRGSYSIVKPHDHDILPGRGQGPRNHPGNIYLREKALEYTSQYKATSIRSEKGEIASLIVNLIESRDPPGRFLMKETKDSKILLIQNDRKENLERVKQIIRDIINKGVYSSKSELVDKKLSIEQDVEILKTNTSNNNEITSSTIDNTSATLSDNDDIRSPEVYLGHANVRWGGIPNNYYTSTDVTTVHRHLSIDQYVAPSPASTAVTFPAAVNATTMAKGTLSTEVYQDCANVKNVSNNSYTSIANVPTSSAHDNIPINEYVAPSQASAILPVTRIDSTMMATEHHLKNGSNYSVQLQSSPPVDFDPILENVRETPFENHHNEINVSFDHTMHPYIPGVLRTSIGSFSPTSTNSTSNTNDSGSDESSKSTKSNLD